MKASYRFTLLIIIFLLTACQPGSPSPAPSGPAATLKVLAIESFLADITRNVTGNRLQVDSLIPTGLDPHAFEPTPHDLTLIADCRVLVVNGGGLEEWLQKTLSSSGSQAQVIEASAGLATRSPHPGEPALDHSGDPHFWLDPNNVIRYVENIRDGLSQADPDGKTLYSSNAAVYIQKLKDLDGQIQQQVATIPPERRLLVTNHESFGYFADRYGFKVVGTIIPSATTGASPSAQQLAQLVDAIRQTGAPAIFLETGANPQLAQQIAAETGVRVVTDLYSHSLTPPDGPAPTYIDMMKNNVQAIVGALK
jgi:ABC-type Zn uptake system ZnuABC Zn-binding protein ZnuA